MPSLSLSLFFPSDGCIFGHWAIWTTTAFHAFSLSKSLSVPFNICCCKKRMRWKKRKDPIVTLRSFFVNHNILHVRYDEITEAKQLCHSTVTVFHATFGTVQYIFHLLANILCTVIQNTHTVQHTSCTLKLTCQSFHRV